MTSLPPMVHHVSKTTVKPPLVVPPTATKRCNLTPWDLLRLSQHYTQVGLIYFNPPQPLRVDHIVGRLQTSLSAALFHFSPLAGRLMAEEELNEETKHPCTVISIECSAQGAELTHAVAHDVTVNMVLAPFDDVPPFIHAFFPLQGALNYDGRFLPLLAVQVTALADGIFLAFSFNHVVGDGGSFSHFLSVWSEISRANAAGVDVNIISRPPVLQRWFIDGASPPIKLPFFKEEDAIVRYSPPALRTRMFEFTPTSLARLRARANAESETSNITSFQALCSLIWRSVTRARKLAPNQETSCMLAIDNRLRMRPPLSRYYFGNAVDNISSTTTAGELLANGLGWGALRVQGSVASHNDMAIKGALRKWLARPVVHPISASNPRSVMVAGSARFSLYEFDFGWGRPVGVRNGDMSKFDGTATLIQGREGRGSIDVELCMVPEAMSALQSDPEFTEAVSRPLPRTIPSRSLC